MRTPYLDYLLDTGVANRLALDDSRIVAKIASAHSFYIPNVVLGEMYFGAYFYAYRNNSTKFLDLYNTFYARYQHRLIACDDETAHIYGAISAELSAKASPIQQNDMWIAALARQHQRVLATLDRDFERVSSLTLELW